jgi:hypothetical protein
MSAIITVTGNSGKTTFAYYLSKALEKEGRKIALVSTDGEKPMSRLLLPTGKADPARSLGRLLSLAVVTKTDLFDNARVLGKNLLLFSYTDGDGAHAYPEIAGANLRGFYERLSAAVDAVVVDTSSAGNVIDNFFRERAGADVCITTADARGLAWRELYKPSGVQLVLPTCRYNATADVLGTFKDVRPLLLPYCTVLTVLYNGVDIPDITPPRQYMNTVGKVVAMLDPQLQPQGQ